MNQHYLKTSISACGCGYGMVKHRIRLWKLDTTKLL